MVVRLPARAARVARRVSIFVVVVVVVVVVVDVDVVVDVVVVTVYTQVNVRIQQTNLSNPSVSPLPLDSQSLTRHPSTYVRACVRAFVRPCKPPQP